MFVEVNRNKKKYWLQPVEYFFPFLYNLKRKVMWTLFDIFRMVKEDIPNKQNFRKR